MNSAQKLQLIQKLSGLSQEKLAQRLGVSFPTVNSWFNQRSNPHESKQRQIDALYFSLTGEKTASSTTLEAKKNIIGKKRMEMKNILEMILRRPDIHDQFMLSLTYHTNRIEGSTLSEPETRAILFDHVSLPHKNLVEQMEVKNHQAALDYLFKYLSANGKVDEAFILRLQGMLLNGIREDAGQYRQHGVRIVGTNVPTANYVKIPSLMNQLIKDICDTKEEIIPHTAQIHSRFEQIHPFSDGNGRVGRLLIHAMLFKRNIPPAIIRQEKKRFYIESLNRAQLKEDFSALEEFLCDAILAGFNLIEKSL